MDSGAALRVDAGGDVSLVSQEFADQITRYLGDDYNIRGDVNQLNIESILKNPQMVEKIVNRAADLVANYGIQQVDIKMGASRVN